jgi:two-component SAPR family response regulator
MADPPAGALEGRKLLVVEDDYLIALELTHSLQDVGARIIGPVATIAEAAALIDDGFLIDGAILDINLDGQRVYPLAERLRARGVPFVFTTGYDDWVLPKEFADVPRLEKPVETAALARALGERIKP